MSGAGEAKTVHPADYFEAIHDRDWGPTSDGRIRLAVLGLGGFARETVLPALDDAGMVEVTTLISGSPETAAAVADEHGVEHVVDYDDFEAGVNVQCYDAVYVGGPNAYHPDYGATAAEHGKHVIVEKPMAATHEGAVELVDACEDAGVTLMVAYRPQLEPVLRRVRSLVRDGGIGDVVQVHGGFSGEVLAMNPDRDQWRLSADLAGGGALLDVGVYPLNTTRFLLGADPVAVRASTHSAHDAFTAVEEHVAFQLEFPDGASASCTASYNAHPDNRLQLLGTDGTVVIEDAYDAHVRPTVTVEHGAETVTTTPEFVDEVREEFEYFADCVLSGRRPEPDGHDGAVDLAVAEAVYESATSGQRVPVPPVGD